MKISFIVQCFFFAALAGIDLYSLVFVNHYVGVWTTITLLVATTTFGLTLLKRTRRILKRYLAERYGESVPSDIIAIVTQRRVASLFFTLALLFPGFISDIIVVMVTLPSLSTRNFELLVDGYRKEAARQGKSVEDLCTPAACPAVEHIRKDPT